MIFHSNSKFEINSTLIFSCRHFRKLFLFQRYRIFPPCLFPLRLLRNPLPLTKRLSLSPLLQEISTKRQTERQSVRDVIRSSHNKLSTSGMARVTDAGERKQVLLPKQSLRQSPKSSPVLEPVVKNTPRKLSINITACVTVVLPN